MKGNNNIHINDATIIEAMQEYFQSRYKSPIKVTGVKRDGSNGFFIVSIEGVEKEQVAK